MTEFTNRIAMQRKILEIINARNWTEELFGLSSKAIERWLITNKIDRSSSISIAIHDAGAKLFFLANRSQEQIAAEYNFVSNEIMALTSRLSKIVAEYP